MQFGTINDNGQSVVILKDKSGLIKRLTDIGSHANIDCGKDMLDLVRTIGKQPDILNKLETNYENDEFLDENTFEWLPPLSNPSKILGVAFNNKELMKKAHRDPGVPNFFLKPPSDEK